MRENIWIGLVHVKPTSRKSALSSKAKGAYANAMTLAKDSRDFEEKVRNGVQDYGLELIHIEDAETFDARIEGREVSSELRSLAELVENSDKIYFDAFCNYFSDDEIQ